jgi:hypothetical protein
MVTITADESLKRHLTGLTEFAELRDDEGRLLAYVTPAGGADPEQYRRARAHFDPAEKDRRKQSGAKEVTTEQLLHNLDALTDRN